MPNCTKCNKKLTSKNWYSSLQKKKQYLCKQCLGIRRHRDYLKHKKSRLEYNRKYYLKHRNELIQKSIRYTKLHRVKLRNGKLIWIKNKRLNPLDSQCELCFKIPTSKRGLAYHHWDDKHPEIGMWLCYHCHFVAESFERGECQKYLALKERILKEKYETSRCG